MAADDHMIFIKRDNFLGRRTHHIHAALPGHRLWQGIIFRDYLKANNSAAREYSPLKLRLSEVYKKERERYTDAKSEFIKRCLAQARADE
ncbi:hypothetical protein SMSP2_00812 [Limihaloglobus sulfuriphilus]|uniref:GrpB protein n=1 Tax=Limihaloglobus sulfuriphilus TaxID=1851148 RepID=A0A1Q2MCN8_9BACT|nr:hypothetical protein SMSP2_00812 [Limihaloglobus sulfuriphilus]